jgi:hypothetical protein
VRRSLRAEGGERSAGCGPAYSVEMVFVKVDE